MKINDYSFGKIVIDGKEFDYDVIILENEIKKWWRKEGHSMGVSDITDYIDIDKEKPEVAVIGTGSSGIMEVSEPVKRFLGDENIKFIIQKTSDAVNSFNDSENKIGFFHLTC